MDGNLDTPDGKRATAEMYDELREWLAGEAERLRAEADLEEAAS